MKAGAMIESKFLKKEDLDYDNGNLVTIVKLEQQNAAMADQEEDLKWCMYFREFKKPLVMNSTNIQLTVKALGTDETDEWTGRKIIIYVDDNVSFGGKLVGGIRIRRAPGGNARPAASRPAAADDQYDDRNPPPRTSAPRGTIDDIKDDIPF
jgi:hypothetical protein